MRETADPRSQRPPLEYTEAFRSSGQQDITVAPIGYIESPYKERFGTPRQPTVTRFTAGGGAQTGAVIILPEYRKALEDLGGFSHVWLICHLHLNHGWKPDVMPPRGPRRRRGLFATRAPHRPNQLSLSAVEITSVDVDRGRVEIRGLDLLDGTPVLDLKPYVPYCDAFPDANAGWIEELQGSPTAPDRLDYWPPPAHLMPDVGMPEPDTRTSRAEGPGV
jgi:tRNA-Thr(GGU) m(6)t(6)A37 methyltransferase TsaA